MQVTLLFIQHKKNIKKNFLMNHCFGTESQRGNQNRIKKNREKKQKSTHTKNYQINMYFRIILKKNKKKYRAKKIKI